MSVALRDVEACETFLEYVRAGVQPLSAGLAVGWTPAKTRQMLKDNEFNQLVQDAFEQADESVEQALYRAAIGGNVSAMQMWLYNRRPERWRDTKRIEVKSETTINLGVVQSVKQAAAELLREHGTAALQPGGALDLIDAEVVEDAERST
jgi:hypothetical protein